MIQQFINQLDSNGKDRCRVRGVFKFGKYFFKPILDGTPEYEKWKKESMVILYDIKTEQQMLDFMCQIKKLDLKFSESGCVKMYYVPELGQKDAALITVGPHVCHDGITQFQVFNTLSDSGGKGPSPFMKRPVPSFVQWAIIYLSAPVQWYFALKHYVSKKSDKNCIKKHGIYMSGNFSCHNSKVLSVQKTKDLSKKMGITLNDLILGITSKILKGYFVSKGDNSDQITLTMPFTFKAVPENKDNYTYGNKFVSLTLYLKLIDNLE